MLIPTHQNERIRLRARSWDKRVDDYKDEVASELEKLITTCVDEVFGRFPVAHAVVNGRIFGLYQELLEVGPPS